MSSKTVTKHKQQATQSGGFFVVWLGHSSLQSLLRERSRSGIRFAFAARRSVGGGAFDAPQNSKEKRAVEGASPYGRGFSVRITERSGVTLVPRTDSLDVREANLASLPKANVGHTVHTV